MLLLCQIPSSWSPSPPHSTLTVPCCPSSRTTRRQQRSTSSVACAGTKPRASIMASTPVRAARWDWRKIKAEEMCSSDYMQIQLLIHFLRWSDFFFFCSSNSSKPQSVQFILRKKKWNTAEVFKLKNWLQSIWANCCNSYLNVCLCNSGSLFSEKASHDDKSASYCLEVLSGNGCNNFCCSSFSDSACHPAVKYVGGINNSVMHGEKCAFFSIILMSATLTTSPIHFPLSEASRCACASSDSRPFKPSVCLSVYRV